jgi:CRISPR-associated endonuclease Csy4
MKFYQELTLLENTECNSYFLWSKLYEKLHLALATIQNNQNIVQLGVSFPEYNQETYQLGCKLRIFSGDEDDLVQLDINSWLKLIKDYIHISEIRNVPKNIIGYAIYNRQQAKSSNERLARRKAKRTGISLEEANAILSKYKEKMLKKIPYINIVSLSSKKHFPLFINRKDVPELINNGFNSYGLSNISSVPEF